MDLILLLCSLAVPSDCVERRIPVTIEAAPSSLCYTGVAVAAIAEAMRAPVAIPPKGDSNADAMRLLTKVRRSELQYRRALQQSVAHSDRTKRAYDVKRKAKK